MGFGGLRVRSITLPAQFTFLALAVDCSDFGHLIIPHKLVDAPYHACENALRLWKERPNQPPPYSAGNYPSKSLGCSRVKAVYKGLLGQPQTPLPEHDSLQSADGRQGHCFMPSLCLPWALEWTVKSSMWQRAYIMVSCCAILMCTNSVGQVWAAWAPMASSAVRALATTTTTEQVMM